MTCLHVGHTKEISAAPAPTRGDGPPRRPSQVVASEVEQVVPCAASLPPLAAARPLVCSSRRASGAASEVEQLAAAEAAEAAEAGRRRGSEGESASPRPRAGSRLASALEAGREQAPSPGASDAEAAEGGGRARSTESKIAKVLLQAEARRQQGLPVLDFAVGNPTINPPPELLGALQRLLRRAESGLASGLFRYTHPAGDRRFRATTAEVISKWQKVDVPADCVVTTPGAQSALVNLLGVLLRPGDVVMTHRPCYPDYAGMVELWQAELAAVDFDPDTFDLDMTSFESVLAEAGGRLRCVILCSPGNPTGRIIRSDAMRHIAQLLSAHQSSFSRTLWLVCDHTYWRLTFGTEVPPCFELYPASIVVSSYSKDLSLAGERLGFAVVNPSAPGGAEIVAQMTTNGCRMGNLSPPALIQHAITDVYREHGTLPSLVDFYRPRLFALREGLLKAGMRSCLMPEGAFYLFPRLPEGVSDEEFCLACSERGVITIPGTAFECPGYVRFAAMPDLRQIEDGCAIIRSVLQTLTGLGGSLRMQERADQEGDGSGSEQPLCEVEPCPAAPRRCSLGVALPLDLLCWDHYTLICSNAAKVAQMHCELLGYEHLRIQRVNTGTVPETEFDMLNYVLKPPSTEDAGRVLVVTEGLNDDTIFRKYLKKFGPGIHHVAYQVADVDAAFAALRAAGYRTTSDHVMHDMLTGLKQVFIDSAYTGYFVELIQRPAAAEPEEAGAAPAEGPLFTAGNMAGLANSMAHLVSAGEGAPSASRRSSLGSQPGAPGAAVAAGRLARLCARSRDPSGAAAFLCRALGFRALRAEGCGDGAARHLHLPREPRHVVLVAQARDGEQPGLHRVDFGVPDVGRWLAAAEANGLQQQPLRGGVRLRGSERRLAYQVGLLCDSAAVELSQAVQWDRDSGVLSALIRSPRESVVAFLADIENLHKWTGHKGIHAAGPDGRHKEFRLDKNGKLVHTDVGVSVAEEQAAAGREANLQAEAEASVVVLTFSWAQLDLRVVFRAARTSASETRIEVQLPSPASERRTAELLALLSTELSILKGLLEGNAARCVEPVDWQRCDLYHLTLLGAAPPCPAVPDIEELRAAGFKGQCLRAGDGLPGCLEDFCSDFALVRRAEPLLVLRPVDEASLAAMVRFAGRHGLRVGARGGRVSHSAGGQALAAQGLLLDMSSMGRIEFAESGDFVDVDAGASWHEVVSRSVERGLTPPVVTDWQYLSVGGTISMGGLGFMSHREGLQASHVLELDVVTGTGAVVTCGPDVRPDLFRVARCGLGHFGVISRVRMPLRAAPRAIRIIRMFYLQSDLGRFMADCNFLLDRGGVDLIHAFVKPRTPAAVTKALGADGASVYADALPAFRSAVESVEHGGPAGRPEVLFYLELGLYDADASIDGDITSGLGPLAGASFGSTMDYMSYITREPPVVQINRERGPVPHPSVAMTLGGSAAHDFLQLYLESDRGATELTEVLITPLWRPSKGHAGEATPMFPCPEGADAQRLFFVLVLGSAVPASAEEIAAVHARHLKLHDAAVGSMGAKRYPYDTVEVTGEAAWASHFGAETWEDILKAKRKYDPLHLFSPGVKMFS